jgi:hypothetical protein
VWDALAAGLPENAHLIHGQRITAEGQEVEIDLLVIWPDVGTAVLEVKGGIVSLEDGRWMQAGAREKHEIDSPIAQAQRAKHALVDYMEPRLGAGIGACVHMAVFPYTHLPTTWQVPDAPGDLVVDATQLDGVVGRIVAALRAHTHHPPIGEASAAAAVTELRRTERAIVNHQSLADMLEDKGNLLTAEQERVIELLQYQRRAELIGGAGSGKTNLAILKARQFAREGKRTALMCYSRGLARHFQLLSSTWPARERPTYIGNFHQLPVRWGAAVPATAEPEWFEDVAPRVLAELAAGRAGAELFDAVVVDEAQDFRDSWWDALLTCFRDPADPWLYVFTDSHQRIFDREGAAPVELNPFVLGENLRNARNIALAFAPLASVRQRVRNDMGEPVRFVDVDPGDVLGRADDAVEALIAEGWDPGRIALLTTGHRHPEQVNRIDVAGHDSYWDAFFAGDDVFYGHVRNFKGLERSAVVVAFNGAHDAELAGHLLYVGMSRATSLLVVVGPREQIEAAAGIKVMAELDTGMAWCPPEG